MPSTATDLSLHGIPVEDTFAEAFSMKAARLIVTAVDEHWARVAATEFCGHASSVIACDVEAGIERVLAPDETPDGRPGVSVLAFGFSRDSLATAMTTRVGQCVLTCATTACFNGLPEAPAEQQFPLGAALRFFGDGYQISKSVGGRRYWRIPVMDGEFLCEDRCGTVSGIGGGNLIFCGDDPARTLAAARAAAEAASTCPDVILPFPGGIVRSGSKVGSKYKGLKASTNHEYCPSLRGIVPTALPDGCRCVYEIVLDGLTFAAVQNALRAGLHAAAESPGLLKITAGNYGGKLGKHHFSLRDLL